MAAAAEIHETPGVPVPGAIQALEVEQYGCIRASTTLKLTRLHALIGPNDSGKSTILRALRTAAQMAVGQFDGQQPGFRHDTSITLRFDGGGYGVQRQRDGMSDVLFSGLTEVARGRRSWNEPSLLSNPSDPAWPVLRTRISPPTLVRFEPDCLRAASALIPEWRGVAFDDERGTGLASVFDAIVNRDVAAFARIQDGVRKLFPTIARVGLLNVSNGTKQIATTLTDGTRISADEMSEGLLYYLAFSALEHITGSRLFLVEEPENGLHPARIADVMTILRAISTTAQVVLATHSPLVVNELAGDEVTVVTRDPGAGTTARLLKDVPGFDDAMKVYRPGEFWVSYADGDREAPLLAGTPRR